LAIERPDGVFQWIYGGMPFYRWTKDKEEGDTTGHGLARAWHVATPWRRRLDVAPVGWCHLRFLKGGVLWQTN